MKKAMRLFLAFVLVSCMLFAAPLCVNAESTSTKDGLEVTVTTDKDVFFAEEDIKLNLSIKNTNTYIIEAIDVETVLPTGLSSKAESVNADDINIEAGETYNMELILQANGKNSNGKGMPLWIWFIIGGVALLIVGAVVALVFANKRKNKQSAKKVLSLLLCFTMALAIAPIGVNAEGEEESPALTTITVDKSITASDKDYNIKWNISCPQENSAPTCNISFNSNGGKDVEVLSVNKGEVPQMPIPEKDDHFFVGWYTDAELSTLFDYAAPMYKSCQVYARWIDLSDTTDTDGEGLYDVLEDFYGTDKTAEDTDGDGLDDYIEINQFGYDPTKADTDGNGVNDIDEDFDGDSLKNKAEIDVGTDPVLADADADGLDDGAELNTHKTDANNKDTDGDGVSDGKEVEIGTNPLVAEASFDLDYSAKENGDSVKASVKIQLSGDQVDSLKIEPVNDDVYFPTTIPGYLGKAYDFSVDGSFDSAIISFDFDLGNADPFTFQPTIYYYNESTQELEALETTIENGIASATVTHFSTYILIDRTVYEESFKWTDVWTDNMFTAVEVVLVIDDSGSMDWNDEYDTRLSVAKTLIDKLPKDSLIGITKFASSTTKLTAGLISDKEAAKAYLTTTHFKSSGGTAMYTAINDSFALFTATEETTLKMMVVLSDGESDGTYKHADTITAANDKNIRIYTVGLGSSSESYFNNYLKPLAVNTGAAFYYASNADQLAEIYEDINEKIDIETDSDGDGIPDYYEENLPMFNGVALKMDKNKTDSDGDTIPDNKELELKYEYNEDRTQVKVTGKLVLGHPALKDTDWDGFDDNVDPEPFYRNVTDRDLVMFSQIVYEDIPAGTALDTLKNTHPDMASSIERAFNGAASLSELKGWYVLTTWYAYGLQAAAYRKGDDIVVAFRGSEDLGEWSSYEFYADWIVADGLGFITGFNAEVPAAKKFMQTIMETYTKENIYITGHSLGGNLAYNAASKALSIRSDSVKKINVYNGLGLLLGVTIGITDVVDEQRLVQNASKVYSYKVDGDIVSRIPLTFHYGTEVNVSLCPEAYGAHDLHSFLDKKLTRDNPNGK